MAKVNKTNAAPVIENEESATKSVEQFYESYKKKIWGALIAVLVILLAILAYSKFIYAPAVEEAQQQTFPAEQAFRDGNYSLALKGDDNTLGFEQIIEDYGTKAGQAVYMYAGVCALRLGEFENAISFLQKYNGKDEILAARAKACEGDAYVGLEDYDNAVKCFNAAAAKADNIFAADYLVKAGLVYEKLGDKQSARKCYDTVKDKYPNSVVGYEIDTYIAALGE